ncbi:MAG: hypothetical protein ACK57W_03895, partial [Flavobacteriales bacterium]
MESVLIVVIIAVLVALIGYQKGWNNIFSASRNDLVFEGKNKSYGAYDLRKSYNRNLAFAVFGVILGATAIAVSPLILKGGDEVGMNKEVEVVMDMLATPPTDPNEPAGRAAPWGARRGGAARRRA